MDNTQDPNNPTSPPPDGPMGGTYTPNPTTTTPLNPSPYGSTSGSIPDMTGGSQGLSDLTSPLPPPPFNPQAITSPQDLNPTPTWQPPSVPPISTPDVGSTFTAPPPQSPFPWNPPVQPIPETTQPTWPPPPPPQPPTPQPAPPTVNTPSSPLDNPWGAPSQPPQIDGGEQPASWQPTPTTPPTNQETSITPAPQMQEQTPTDLSHLISNAQGEGNRSSESELTQPETLVVPPNGSPEVPTIPTDGTRKGIPKWLIGVGVGLLLIVIGATAYFILGIGQSKTSTSVPAQTTQQIKPPAPVATPVATATAQPSATPATASGSANFGQLGGSSQQQATSAADLLRQRQQQGR